MYEKFFGFKRRPFPVAPATELYFPAGPMEQARETLSRLIERAEGPGLLIGPAGTGKSLLCQVLSEQFRQQFQVAQLVSGQICTRRALLQALLYSLRLPYRNRAEGELRLSLMEHLASDELPGNAVLLIIDEAHGLPLRLLEELRVITNLAQDGEPRVRLILAGDPLLEEHLGSPKLESFSQRFAARCYLAPFENTETAQYVQAQVAAARQNDQRLFTDEALRAVHRATDGVPRLVNQVCDHALVLAFAAGIKQLDEAAVEEAWADLQQLPLPQRIGIAASRPQIRHEVVEFGSLDDLDSSDGGLMEANEGMSEDELAEAIPFPSGYARRLDPEEQVERIAHHLAGLEEEFLPIGSIGPEVELIFQESADPFGDGFAEEEVVFDRYAALDERYLRSRPRVVNRTGDRFSEMVIPPGQAVSHPRGPAVARAKPSSVEPPPASERARPAVRPSSQSGFDPVMPEHEDEIRNRPAAVHRSEAAHAEVPPDDRDLIIVEDEPLATPRVRRQEYRQLFAKLRRSS